MLRRWCYCRSSSDRFSGRRAFVGAPGGAYELLASSTCCCTSCCSQARLRPDIEHRERKEPPRPPVTNPARGGDKERGETRNRRNRRNRRNERTSTRHDRRALRNSSQRRITPLSHWNWGVRLLREHPHRAADVIKIRGVQSSWVLRLGQARLRPSGHSQNAQTVLSTRRDCVCPM